MHSLSSDLQQIITQHLNIYDQPLRRAWSSRFPVLKLPIVKTRQTIRRLEYVLNKKIARTKQVDDFAYVYARHQSILRRILGNSDSRLQEQKITNLQVAVAQLNGLVIQPQEIFSLWNTIGAPSQKRGFVNGMLLANGRVIEGMGGGLCQLSNLLYWLFLHAPVTVLERYHHSMDVFPDSGRVLPFGSGATILYNFVDLRIQNTSPYPLQLKIWLTDNHLKGQLRSPVHILEKFHLYERNHYFIQRQENYFRYNEIWRDMNIEGRTICTEKITQNFAPVLYDCTPEYISQNNFSVVSF
ncbi:MAG: VanW family protein [Candidatus Kerfeldbacteria bacterium]|nr:VanW family protein [Candidatus Kerfeldbacteria bacterium]